MRESEYQKKKIEANKREEKARHDKTKNMMAESLLRLKAALDRNGWRTCPVCKKEYSRVFRDGLCPIHFPPKEKVEKKKSDSDSVVDEVQKEFHHLKGAKD